MTQARASTRAPRPRRSRVSPDEVADELAIRDLKARYAYFADHKYDGMRRRRQPQARVDRAARAQANCFTRDALWEGGRAFGKRLVGRAALFAFFRGGPWRFAMHFYVAPIIEVDGDRARGWWRLWQLAVPRGTEDAVFFAAVTAEEYRREREGWLHSAVRFEHMHFVRPASGGALHMLSTLS
ncbi:MAG: nuclear transport factor 2 family protein [Steroidobacteraceae bacterium]